MVVKNIRYGETWGMGCGPVSGPTFVELMACDKEGNSTFIITSILESDLKINNCDCSGNNPYAISRIFTQEGATVFKGKNVEIYIPLYPPVY